MLLGQTDVHRYTENVSSFLKSLMFNAMLQIAASSKSTKKVDKDQASNVQPGRFCSESIVLEIPSVALQMSTVGLHKEGQDLCLFCRGNLVMFAKSI